MRKTLALLALGSALAAVGLPAVESDAPRAQGGTQVALLRLGTFSQPTYLTAPPGDGERRFVTERAGRIKVVAGGRMLTFLDISGRVQTGGESGLLSMAFDPGFARNRLYYVYYVDNGGSLRVDRYRASARNPNRTARGSRRSVVRESHFRANHKGGQVAFGRDGMLYVGFGDGGGGGDPDENAQNLGVRLGKILRIDPRPGGGFRVPRSNPFVGRPGVPREIWAYGLRNPYRFSFDRVTGSLALSDVGQDQAEEINFLRASRRARRPRGGANFGWDAFEGRRRFEGGSAPGHVLPALQRLHSQGSCSITGGYVIRDRGLGSLYGAYVYGDLCDSRLRVARLRSAGAVGDRALGPNLSRVVSFGEDGRGRVYVVSLNGGVFRLAARR